MKRKLIYSILFVSLFLISTASMVQPVQGYDVSLPAEAKGHEVEATLDVYDEDEWDKHLGAGVDREGLKEGDSDVVGAKDKYKILEWEEDEDLIDYMDDFVTGPAGFEQISADIIALLQSLADINGTVGGSLPAGMHMYGPYGSTGWLATYALTMAGLQTFGFDQEDIAIAATPIATAAQGELYAAIKNYTTLMSLYSESYDGLIMEREKWHWTDEEFDEDPDIDDDEVPFFYDPRDWADVAESLAALENDIKQDIDSIQADWGDSGAVSGTPGWYATLAGGSHQANESLYQGIGGTAGALGWAAYEFVNDTIYDQVMAIDDPVVKGTLLVAMNQPSDVPALLGYPLAGGYGHGVGNYSTDWVLGLWGLVDNVLENVFWQVGAALPGKAGFFLAQLIAGQPAASPSEDFMRKVLETYDINDEVLSDMYKFEYGRDISGNGEISTVPLGMKSRFTGVDLGGETIYPQAYLEFSVEGDVVTVEVDWPDDYIDPKDDIRWLAYGVDVDGEDELKDFEIIFGGGNVWKDGDEIFWQTSEVEAIPGYEVTILLGASAISVLALVYVIMKKRKK